MKNKQRRKTFVTGCLLFCLCLSTLKGVGLGLETKDLATKKEVLTSLVYEATPAPSVGSVGGDWAVFGLAQSEAEIPLSYFQEYYNQVEQEVMAKEGILHDRKYTEYARVILALSAIGADVTRVGGYNLLTPLADFDKTIWQGINGPIWALIALDSKNYPMPICKEGATQATREAYVSYLLDQQNEDGGFSLSGTKSDPDICAMALQALAPYQGDEKVDLAIDSALLFLSLAQDSSGGFSSFYSVNTEATAQCLVALCALDISLDDPRFIKNGNGLWEGLLSCYQEGKGFSHDGSSTAIDPMSTEQGLYATTCLWRYEAGLPFLYDLTCPSMMISQGGNESFGLPNRSPFVSLVPLLEEEIEFCDIATCPYKSQIIALSCHGIVGGRGQGIFDPFATMTRGEFATIIVKALGLTPKITEKFSDVAPLSWFAPYVGAAQELGIVLGKSPTTFCPESTITREEAAVMVARAALLCGWPALQEEGASYALAPYMDYVFLSPWALSSTAFCVEQEMFPLREGSLCPEEFITRDEVCFMLYELLEQSLLLQ